MRIQGRSRARLATEELLRRFGLTDERFAALGLDPDQAADAVLGNGRFAADEEIEIKPLSRRLLTCFYRSLPENPDLLSQLLPDIHRESLRRLGRLEAKQDRAQQALDAILARVGGGHETLEQFWDEWSSASNPALPTALLTAGRHEAQERLLSWLDAEPGVLTVAGDTEEEAAAFVYAALTYAPDGAGRRHLDRAIMLRPNGDVARLVEASSAPMLLVATDLDILKKHAGRAKARGHHVVIAMARRVGMRDGVVDLPRVPRTAFGEALQSAGLDEEETKALAWATGRSIPVLRRQRALEPELYRPVWADAAGLRDVLPFLFAGGWDGRNRDDRDAVVGLAGRSWAELELALTRLANQPDPPVRKIGEVWRLIAPVDTFFMVAGASRRDDLNRLMQVALDVLSRIDPALEMPPDERRYASIHGKRLQHSEHIRRGLVQGLKLIGVYGERVLADLDGRRITDRVARELLLEAPGARWCTLGRLLPDLAEAGPDAFLTAVEHSLTAAPPPIMQMFEEEKGWIGDRTSRHPGLLWALEGLAWHPDYLSRVSLILAKLTRLDPGGRLNNRPLNSLRAIFLPWLIQTAANAERREEAIDVVVDREPLAAWKLLVAIGPKHHDSSMHIHKPSALWRDELSFSERRATPDEYLGAVRRNAWRMFQLAGTEPARWVDLTEMFPQLPLEHREGFLTTLRTRAETGALEGASEELRGTLRNLLDRHRTFEGRTGWAMPKAEADRLEEIYILLAPPDPVKRHLHLFNTHWPNLPEGRERRDYGAQMQAIEEARAGALRDVLASDGPDAITRLAMAAEIPALVGHTTESAGLDADAERVLVDRALDTGEAWGRGFATGLLTQRVVRAGWARAQILLTRASEEGWDQEHILRLLFALPESVRLWDEVAALGPEIHQRYWSEIEAPFVRDADEALRAIDELLTAGRPLVAYCASRHLLGELPGLVVARLLSAVATDNDRATHDRLESYAIEQAFKAIDTSEDVQTDVVVRLEWAFFPFLEDSERQPRELYRALAEDPNMFLTFVRWASPHARPEQVPAQVAARASQVLSRWNRIPGTDRDGDIDSVVLMDWIEATRQQCKETEHLEYCDYRIGRMFATSSMGEDGAWPAEPVRDVIDRIASEVLDDGFWTGIYNSRGAVWRGPGGAQERELAERYRRWASQIAGRWPRTGTILRRIAEGYESEGRGWDIDDELRDLD